MSQLAASGTQIGRFIFECFLNYTGIGGRIHANDVFIDQGQRNVRQAITAAMVTFTPPSGASDGRNMARVEFDSVLNTSEKVHVVVELKVTVPVGEFHNLAPIGFFSWLVTSKDTGRTLMTSNGFVPGTWVVFVTP